MKSELTAERLRELLHYDPETGIFTRRLRTSNRIKVGDVAGCLHCHGYIEIRVGDKKQKAHRLAWLYVFGKWPCWQVDHINGCRSDNRLVNLRDVDQFINQQNQRSARADNAIGMQGVGKNGSGYRARLFVGGKSIQIGTYATPELARSAYIDAKRELHPGGTL